MDEEDFDIAEQDEGSELEIPPRCLPLSEVVQIVRQGGFELEKHNQDVLLYDAYVTDISGDDGEQGWHGRSTAPGARADRALSHMFTLGGLRGKNAKV